MRRHPRARWVAILGALLPITGLAGCVDDPDELTSPTSSSTTAAPTTAVEPTSTTEPPPYPGSPTSVDDALAALDGLLAASVLRPATVGIDPLTIQGDPTTLLVAVDEDRLMDDVRLLAEDRGVDSPDGLAAAADVMIDGFGDAGYRVATLDLSVPAPASPDGDGTDDTTDTTTDNTDVTDDGSADTPEDSAEDTPDEVTAPIVRASVAGATCEDRAVLVTAHYDAPSGSPGARDATGSAVLLEVARVLAEDPLPMTVSFAALPFGAEGEDAAEAVVADLEDPNGPTRDVVATFALDGMGVVGGDEDEGLTGVAPQYLLLMGDRGSEYLARVTTIATARFLPGFWAFSSVPDLDIFRDLDGREASPWWDVERPALLFTDLGADRDERVGTEEDEPALIDPAFLANATRTVLAALTGVGTIDGDNDGEPDVCQRD